ncbi:uncharacterized protein LOC143208112 [Lasioglossum baleicum]|uniref:uncharacterized protein LOC143208112 n=1 Tax=Lasioglossum baleicum TaxID=434251 RepID=UPI003FCE1B86
MPRTLSVVQTKLNHSRQAQDLFVHGLAERQVGLAVVTEPYDVPDSYPWVGEVEGSVAIWAKFEGFLDRLKVIVTPHLAGPMLVLGDFNAKSTGWGNPRTTSRGEALEVWAGGMELRLVNRGSVPTCVG